MPAQVPLYQEVEEQIKRITAARRLRVTAVRRLALLVTGVIAAKSGVISQVAAELLALGLTKATEAESVARRLRRTLGDARLEQRTCYAPVLGQVLDWGAILQGGRRVVLALDESSKADAVHLFRVSLPYRGGSVPLAWAVWAQNQPLAAGRYWATVDAVLAQVAALLPAGVEVVVVADRAYDIPAFVDRLAAYGWHWVVRCKANGTMRFRDRPGREHAIRDLVRRHLPCPGRRWKGRGQVFKDAGWRDASVVAVWGAGQKEPLVALTDLPARWAVLRLYQRRFWIEPGFRNDKTRGWQWEDSQVRGVAHHERLLLALAWASLVLRCLGAQEAEVRLAARLARRGRRHRPR
ncbi:MAG: transposase, partial [Chloroflexota bacterium]|nr:transposase [Chloroflexota bacterium]